MQHIRHDAVHRAGLSVTASAFWVLFSCSLGDMKSIQSRKPGPKFLLWGACTTVFIWLHVRNKFLRRERILRTCSHIWNETKSQIELVRRYSWPDTLQWWCRMTHHVWCTRFGELRTKTNRWLTDSFTLSYHNIRRCSSEECELVNTCLMCLNDWVLFQTWLHIWDQILSRCWNERK